MKSPAQPTGLRGVARLGVAFGGAAAMLLSGVLTFDAMRRASDDRARVTHSYAVAEQAATTLSALQDAETGQRGFLITGDTTYLEPYNAALASVRTDVTSLRTLTQDNHSQQTRLDTLERLVESKLAELERTVALRRDRGLAAADAVVRTNVGKATMDSIRGVLARVRNEEQRLLSERSSAADQSARSSLIVLVIGTLAAIALALILNGMLTRYADEQAGTARALAEQNDQLSEQATELEVQSEQLHEQATELEEINQHLADQIHVARTASTAKSEFLAAVSHELRTPLNAIDGYSELLLLGVRGDLTSEQESDITRIRKSSRHLLTLINQVLNMSKVESGQIDLEPGIVSIANLLQDVEVLIKTQMDTKGIDFSIAPCDATTVAYADPDRVKQILLNLVANAQKFTDAGGAVRVTCGRSDDGRVLSIAVTDTGRGIPPGKLTEIFEPFTQLNRLLTPDAQRGIGLGLSISRTLARAMGGDLTVVSEVGAGSTFLLTLPMSPADLRPLV